MTSIVVSAKDLLITAGVGIAPPTGDWQIHAGPLPKTPDRVIAIRRTPGAPSNPKWLLDFPSLQIRVRGRSEDYLDAEAKIQAVKDALLGLPSQTVNGDRWTSVTSIGDIIEMGRDEKGRFEFVMNFALIIEPASGTNRTAL